MNGLKLSATVRSALDVVADRQLASGEGPTLDAILLNWPHEAAQVVRTAVQTLVDDDLVTIGRLSSGQETLHLTPLGLLTSHQTGSVSRVAEDMLRFFHRRMADPAVSFNSFEWSDLRREEIANSDVDLPLIRVTLQVLDLAQERAYISEPLYVCWDVPSDIVELRGFLEIDSLYQRAERRRAGDDGKSSLRVRDNARVGVNRATAIADAIGFAHVLAVGVSEYKPSSNFGKLRQCVHDAMAVAGCFRNKPELHSSADKVHELTSAGADRPSRGNIIDQVQALATRASADDRIVFYFSGHGHRIKEQLYLVPEDAWVDDDPDALISLEAVYKRLLASQAKLKIIILDACNTGPNLSELKHPAAQWSEKFLGEYIRKTQGIVTLASSLADQPSSTKSPHPNLSLFTNFIVNALNGETEALDNGLLTIETLFAYVSAYVQRVSNSHHRPQQPAISMSSSGLIVLGNFRGSRTTQSATPEASAKSNEPSGLKTRDESRGEDRPNVTYSVTDPFEPLTARMISEQGQSKGALVAPVLWKMIATPASQKGWTKAQLHHAISGAIPTIDGGTGHRTRLPAVLRSGSSERRRDDGTQLWHLEYKGQGSNELHEEKFGVKTDGTLWFQRAHFCDAPSAHNVLELGYCVYDVVVFIKLLVGIGNSLDIKSYTVSLTVEAPRDDMVVTIKTNELTAKQPFREAKARDRRHKAHIEIGPMTSLPDAVQVKLVQQLVDGIANEFELSGDPFFRGGGAPFLEIDEKSIALVLETLK